MTTNAAAREQGGNISHVGGPQECIPPYAIFLEEKTEVCPMILRGEVELTKSAPELLSR